MINSLAGAVTLHRSHKLLRASRGHILSDGAVGENETEATLCVLWCFRLNDSREQTQHWFQVTTWLDFVPHDGSGVTRLDTSETFYGKSEGWTVDPYHLPVIITSLLSYQTSRCVNILGKYQ